VPNGMSYNSYVIMDEKIAVMDTVDAGFAEEWLENLERVLGNRKPDYLVVHHMEPDHSANIMAFISRYPDVKIVASSRAFIIAKNFFGTDFSERRIIVNEGDVLSLGQHELQFINAPMVHWPEVIMTYDRLSKAIFTADAFGKFGTLDLEDDWAEEARRYYIGIVGKYGVQVQNVLKKISALDVEMICPLHGPVLRENLSYYLGLYDTWSSYRPENDAVLIAYTSIYGNTKKAVEKLEEGLKAKGEKVHTVDLARCDMFKAVSDAFRYSKLVLATTTYNGDIFPFMREYIEHLKERNFSNRSIGFIENGSWAPVAGKIMKTMLEKSKQLRYYENEVKIFSALGEENLAQIEALANEICAE
jgi:flavorubredoxin